jgi:hypothetical protein
MRRDFAPRGDCLRAVACLTAPTVGPAETAHFRVPPRPAAHAGRATHAAHARHPAPTAHFRAPARPTAKASRPA